MIKHVNGNELENILKKEDGTYLIDCFATWCGPCKMLGTELEKHVNEFPCDILKLDIDENEEIAMQLRIQVVPTMFIMKNGKLVEKIEGFVNAQELIKKLN